jgi:hypothetical protein
MRTGAAPVPRGALLRGRRVVAVRRSVLTRQHRAAAAVRVASARVVYDGPGEQRALNVEAATA